MTAITEARPGPPEAVPGRLPGIRTSRRRQEREDKARMWIAAAFVAGYLLVLILSLSPVLLFISRTKNLSLTDVKDLGGVMATAVSSLTGLLGFVLGYYFKAAENRDP